MRYTTFSSPLGELLLAGDDMGLRHLGLPDDGQTKAAAAGWSRDDEALAEARQQILAYLEGRRHSFSVNVAPAGSESQREVWAALMRIPYGQTRTYGELARRLGHDKAVIAISSACGANPLPVLIPCHRVVAAHGLGRYRGGEAAKRHLLALERRALTA